MTRLCLWGRVDLFITANSFWALTAAGKERGEPFRGRLALPGAMQLGVARLGLPLSFEGASYTATQDVDEASITINLTKAGVTVSATVFVSPIAPLVYSTISVSGGGTVAMTLNTSVKDHFYHRESNGYNVSYSMATAAGCPSGKSPA